MIEEGAEEGKRNGTQSGEMEEKKQKNTWQGSPVSLKNI